MLDYPHGPNRIRFATFFARIVHTLGASQKKGHQKCRYDLRFRHLLIGLFLFCKPRKKVGYLKGVAPHVNVKS